MDTPGCPVWSITVGCADTLVAAAGEDEFVRLFDLGTGHLLAEKAAHRDWVRSVSFTPVRRIDVSEARIRSVAMTDNADLVIAATESATIHAFTAGGPAGRAQPPPGVDWVCSVGVAEDGTIVAGCEDGAVRLWRAIDHDQLTLLCSGANTIWSTQSAADGQLAVLGHSNGLIECWDATSAEPRRRLHAEAGRVWSLAESRPHRGRLRRRTSACLVVARRK